MGMDYDYKYKFQDALHPDEHILWCGRPNCGAHFSGMDIFTIPFSLIWAGLALRMNLAAWLSGADFISCLFVLPFLIIGMYLVFGRFLYAAYKKSHTYYALTNYRVLILNSKNNLATQYIRDIVNETITTNRRGRGTITFGLEAGGGYPSPYPEGHFSPSALAFEDIENCQAVYGEYQALKHAAKSGR